MSAPSVERPQETDATPSAPTAKGGRAPVKTKKKFELSRRARRLTLAVHVVTSVGWVGLSLSMVVLAVMGYTTDDPAVAKGVYKAMYVFDDTSVTVFSVSAALSGILLSWGTVWGFMQHFWIIVKWVITLFMTVFAWFVIHPIVIEATKNTADAGRGTPEPGWPAEFLLWSVPMLFVLLTVAAVVSVYKPWGRTARGRRKSAAARRTPAGRTPAARTQAADGSAARA
ncbi:DUF2269 domain-containing protein [Streptomyces sp. NPDC090056]|uniref:DUF2269 domain-containing protein n=1 Tax=Streptomyces sp. NPDC090056 TaxID=3365934 RepID=UPI003820B9C5